MTEKKEDRRVRRTKKLLLQGLTQLMQQKQVKDITVRELAELVDVNRGTFYLYYRDIFDMLEQVETELFARFYQILASHQEQTVLVQTQPMLLELFRFVAENEEICRVLLGSNGDMNFLERVNRTVEERLRADWQKHRDRMTEEEFTYRYAFGVMGCVGLVRAWLERRCQESAEAMALLADRLLLQGIAPDASTPASGAAASQPR